PRRHGLMDAKSVFQLALGHLGPSFNALPLRLRVELLPCVAIGATRPGHRRLAASSSTVFGVSPTHRTRALALSGRANMRSSLPLLLTGAALVFFFLGTAQIAPVAAVALVFRGSRFFQRDRDRLPTAFDRSALATGTALEFAMFEFMHYTSGYALLS